MLKNKIQKSISIILTLAFISTTLTCSAANIVPINGGNVAVLPSAPVTKTNIDLKNPSGSFSLQAMKSKIDEIINPQKSNAELRDYSGTCGYNCSWTLITSIGKLTISGTGNMANYEKQEDVPWYDYRGTIRSVEIENGITSIGTFALGKCNVLNSVKISDSVKSIGNFAFQYCDALESITIPDSVKSIGNFAFQYCKALRSIIIPDSDGGTSIGNFAFQYCDALESIIIPGSVKSIGNFAFQYCESLSLVKFYGNREPSGNSVFNDCDNLRKINVPTTYKGDTFCKIAVEKNLDPPPTSGTCGDNCSWNLNTDTGELIISGTGEMTSHRWSTSYNDSIKSVTIENGITSIVDDAFLNCNELTNVTIPDSIEIIGEKAFEDCSALTSVNIPDSVTSIGLCAFKGCSALTNINVGDSNSNYKSINGVLFDKEMETLIQYPTGNTTTTYEIPNSVTSIGVSAFEGCNSLTNVTIGNSVTSIRDQAFCGCKALSHVYYLGENDPGKFSEDVFDRCRKLTCVFVQENYKDNKFCGEPISKDGKCSVDPSSSSVVSSSVMLQPANWFIKAISYLVPAAILSLLV